MDRIEIYTSKKKSFFLLLGSIAFVVLGFWLFKEADSFTGWRAKNPLFTQGIGIASILFFGIGIFVSLKRLIKSEIALIIDSDGINLNPKKSLTEFIKWDEILGFEEIKIHSTKILVIGVKNPNYWLEQESNAFRRQLMQFNIANYNSPFNIASAALDISSTELRKKLHSYFERYKNEVQPSL